MPTPKALQFDAWSLSRLNDYRKCPALAKFKHLLKLKEPDNPAMERGKTIHSKAAVAISQPNGYEVAPELDRFKTEFETVRSVPEQDKKAELQWAFSSAWKLLPTFFDRATWVRMVLDLRWSPCKGEVCIVDHKTGKVYESNREQNKLYALGEFMAHPDTEVVNTELWYLDQGEIVKDTYTRDQAPTLLKYWDKESRPMMQDTVFDPTPSSNCKWCHFAKSKGGPCTAEE